MVKTTIQDGSGASYLAKVTENGQLVTAPISYSGPYTAEVSSVNTATTVALPRIGYRFVVTGILLDADKNVSASTAGTVVLYEGDSVDDVTGSKTILSIEMLKNTSRSITGLNLIITEGVWLSIKTTDATVFATILGYYLPVPKEVGISLGGGDSEIPVASALLTDLYAWYTMDETTGTRADDLGNWDLDASAGSPSYGTGLISNAFACDATAGADVIYSSTQSAGLGFDGDGDFSVSCWVKFNAGGTFETYISHWGANGSKAWFFSKDASDLIRVDTSSNGTGITQTTTHGSITATNWNHLVFVYDDTAGSMAIYVNNSLSGTTHTDSLSTVAAYYIIFGALGTSSNAMTGLIDLVGLWNRKLEASDVSELYNSGVGITYPF